MITAVDNNMPDTSVPIASKPATFIRASSVALRPSRTARAAASSPAGRLKSEADLTTVASTLGSSRGSSLSLPSKNQPSARNVAATLLVCAQTS
jgi:hypothetical protein